MLGTWVVLGGRGILGLLVSALPADLKRHPRFARYRTPQLHVVSGCVELTAGVFFFFSGMLASVQGSLDGPGWLYFTGNPQPAIAGSGERFVVAPGLLGYLSFLLTPYAWLCLYAMGEGAARALETLVHGTLPGVGPVVVIWRLAVKGKSAIGNATLAWKAGPARPDCLRPGVEGGLELVSYRRYPWEPGQVVDLEGQFYVLVQVKTAQDGRFLEFSHLLRPLEPGELIRGQLVRYHGPWRTHEQGFRKRKRAQGGDSLSRWAGKELGMRWRFVVGGMVLMSATVLAQGVPEIPYEKHVLPNGLTLIIHEDHKAPIVAVNVWYHVGSKNEKKGKTGFAHLFEHLMFNGSEHFNDDYFKALEKVGATDVNGTTNVDRTNYFQNVPSSALDVALFLESDRMGHLLGAIDQAKLDEQRGVVQNEKRQGENQPYGVVRQLLAEYTYPAGHPYSWTTIGSMEDLNAASLEDVKEWFRTYYGPNNAVLVIAGDVNPAEVKAKVEKYFGDIPPGPPIGRQTTWVAKMTGERRAWVQDRVPQARVYMVWNVPPLTDPEADLLDLVASVLSTGKSSRLYKRLVYDEQIATDVSAYVWGKELGSQFMIVATAKPNEDLGKVEMAIRQELAALLMTGPSKEEVERAQLTFRADFLRGIERIGGFGGKSDVLASGEVFYGSPEAYKKQWETVAKATPKALQTVAQKWLSDGLLVLEVHPFPQVEAKGEGIDRSKLPEVSELPNPSFPKVEVAKLASGLQLVVARRPAVPLVELELVVNGGYASDGPEKLGRANLAMAMLDEGTKTRTALAISEELQRLGAELSVGSTLDSSFVAMSALKEKLTESLLLFADIVENPAFPPADFQRLQKQQLAALAREKVTPVAMGLRVLPALLYGAGHPYAVPFTGTGTEATVAKLTREDLIEFHKTYFKPNNATLIAVGDVTLPELQALVEKLFSGWKAGKVPTRELATVSGPQSRAVFLLDRPGSQQSVILAGLLFPPKSDSRSEALRLVHEVLGGSFTSRLNMNLREDKHWSYGARVAFPDARGQRPFFAIAPVQGDKTKEALAEVAKEIEDIASHRPITPEELEKAKGNLTLTLPGRWETNEAVLRSLFEVVQFGLPWEYPVASVEAIKAQDLDTVRRVAVEVLQPAKVVYVVVGDRAKIEAGIRELNLGPMRFLNSDGQVLE